MTLYYPNSPNSNKFSLTVSVQVIKRGLYFIYIPYTEVQTPLCHKILNTPSDSPPNGGLLTLKPSHDLAQPIITCLKHSRTWRHFMTVMLHFFRFRKCYFYSLREFLNAIGFWSNFFWKLFVISKFTRGMDPGNQRSYCISRIPKEAITSSARQFHKIKYEAQSINEHF